MPITRALQSPAQSPARSLIRSLALLSLTVGFAAGCATTVKPPAEPVRTYIKPATAYSTWGRVLQRHVNAQGQIDFATLQNGSADLDRFVAWVYDVGPNTQPQLFQTREDLLAYHINAYNALSMYNIIDAGLPDQLGLWGKYNIFIRRKIRVAGQKMSLKKYEDDVVRKLGDPRIHWAINCMAVSCPRLPREPFRPATVDARLDAASREFFNSPKHVQVDHANRTAYYSEILDFFPEDFLAVSPSLTAYVNRYRDAPIPEDYKVKFLDYDWRINRQSLGPERIERVATAR